VTRAADLHAGFFGHGRRDRLRFVATDSDRGHGAAAAKLGGEPLDEASLQRLHRAVPDGNRTREVGRQLVDGVRAGHWGAAARRHQDCGGEDNAANVDH
jgi:hypothetical protein